MRTVLLASLRTHTRRYVAATLAIVIGVAFVVTTDALASATRNGLVAGAEVPYRQADAVVSDLTGRGAADLVDRARQRGDAASVLGWTMQPVADDGGRLGDRAEIGSVADDPLLRWQRVVSGRFPDAPGEAVVDANRAKSSGVAIGDTLRIGTGERALVTTVVGLVDTPSASVAAAVYVPWDDVARWAATSFYVDSVAYAGPEADLIGSLTAATGATVQTRDAFVEDRSTELSQGVDVVAYVLLLFAAIALFVSVLVIANTFSILFAQRTRDLALLRCVGATRRQVRRSVRLEALALGLVASTLGLLVGAGLGHGLVALADAVSSAPLGAVALSPVWLVGAFAVGMVVTLLASWLPTRRVTTVSPLAALRPDQEVDLRTTAGRVRTGLGAVLVVGGGGLLALAVAATSAQVMLLGGFATFGGVLLLGPFLVPALVRALGAVATRVLGPAGRLATSNAVRHPRRTAATTASLLVGVTLTTAVLTGLASSRSAIDDEMSTQHPVDVILAAGREPLAADVVGDVSATRGIRDAIAVEGTRAEVSGDAGALPVLTLPPGRAGVLRADPVTPGPRQIVLPYELVPADGRVTVTGSAGAVTLRAVGSEGYGETGLVAPATLARLTDAPTTQAVWARADDGTDPADLSGDLEAVARPAGADVQNGLAARAYVDLQLDVLTGAVVALLGIAVLIALIGIGNTLGLSVLERGRENALLRALGLTRRQLRATLAIEAVLLSVVATVLGTTLGVSFAWVGVQAMVQPVVDAPVVLPWTQLALVVLVAAGAGLLSCLVPARRAARTTPAAGLALD